MSELLLGEISKKLDILIALTAAQGADHETKIKILSSKGLSNNEIGRLTGLTGEAIRLKLKKPKNGNKKSQ